MRFIPNKDDQEVVPTAYLGYHTMVVEQILILTFVGEAEGCLTQNALITAKVTLQWHVYSVSCSD